MKKKTRKGIATSITVLALVMGTFTGCGSASGQSSEEYTGTYTTDQTDGDYAGTSYGYGEETYDEADTYDSAAASVETAVVQNTDSQDQTSSKNGQTQQKLIITWNLTMETSKYEETITSLKESVENAGGYIESEEESLSGESSHYDYLTLRIPDDKAQNWVDTVSSCGTITNRQKSTQDATLQYVDTESRLKALRTEQDTLMGMMEKATKVSDLITIQSQLTEVNTEIESCESELRVLDNQVDYTTIYLNISEVIRESVMNQSIGEEIRETFFKSIDHLKNIARYLIVGIIGNSVIIIITAACIAAVVMIMKKIRKRNEKIKAFRKIRKASEQPTENNIEGRTDH